MKAQETQQTAQYHSFESYVSAGTLPCASYTPRPICCFQMCVFRSVSVNKARFHHWPHSSICIQYTCHYKHSLSQQFLQFSTLSDRSQTLIICRYHSIGLLVLFLQDIGDIVLEWAKISYYFKERGGREYALPEHFANFFFALFTIQQ